MKPLHLLVPCLLLANPVFADTLAERREIAAKIVEARNGGPIDIEAFRESCTTRMVEGAKERNATPEATDAVREVTSETLASVTRERLVAAMAEGYATRLNLGELEEVLRFYESPSGKALSREQGRISREADA
jgi:hypothetical protein